MPEGTSKPLKPLRTFDYKLVQEPLIGLLTNIDRDLQRRGKQCEDTDAEGLRCLGLLNVFIRFATNSFRAVTYLAADTPEDPRRQPNFVLVIAPINRQLLDLLFSLIYMVDDFPTRSLAYQRAGWREFQEEYQMFKNTYSDDPEWHDFFVNYSLALRQQAPLLDISLADQRDIKSRVPYWKHPGELKNKKSKGMKFLRWLDKWLYADTSAQSHLSCGGLLKISPFVIAEVVGGSKQQLVESRVIQQYRFQQMSRTGIVTLALATEINAYCELGYQPKISYLWVIFNEYCAEAREMYEHRYAQLCNSTS
jgi:hypothetical protein